MVNVSESYPLDGCAVGHKRRDMRGGKSRGRVVPLDELQETNSRGGGLSSAALFALDVVCVKNEWEEPFAGTSVL